MPLPLDLRYALRRLDRDRRLTVTVVLLLALGIGVNLTVFQLVDAVLLRPLSAAEPDRLVRVVSTADGARRAAHPWADVADLAALEEAFAGVAGTSLVPLVLETGGARRPLLVEVVSADYFSVLGAEMAEGRPVAPREATPTVVLGHRLWQRDLGADPAVVGTEVRLGDRHYTVVGIAGESFSGTFAGAGVDAWLPVEHAGHLFGPEWRHDRERATAHVVARLADGVAAEAVAAPLAALATRLAEAHPESHRGRRLVAEPASLLHGGLRRAAVGFLATAQALVVLVLVATCANLSGLLLARARDRRHEMALRGALGAGRWHLVRQLLAEGLALAAVGGVAGLLTAAWISELLSELRPIPFVPLRLDLGADLRSVAVALALTLAVGLLLTLVPAIHAWRRDLTGGLSGRRGSSTAGGHPQRVRQALVVVQVAVAIVLLASATLVLRSLAAASALDLGFPVDRAVALDLDLTVAGLDDAAARAYFAELDRRLESLPGVQAAARADLAPLDLATRRREVDVPGFAPPVGEAALRLSWNPVTPDYFSTFELAPRAGRLFTDADRADAPAVAVVNTTMAERFWPDGPAVGRSFRLMGDGGGREVEVVGVVPELRYRTLGEEPTAHFYLPFDQAFEPRATVLVAAAEGVAPATLLPHLAALVGEIDPRVQAFFARTLEQHVAVALLPGRIAAVLFTLFGALAVAVAALGIGAALALSLARRTREMGLRLALGARPGDLLRRLVGESLTAAALGGAIGLAVAVLGAPLLGHVLLGVAPRDPLSHGAAVALVFVVALVAAYLPARRVLRLDPRALLRID